MDVYGLTDADMTSTEEAVVRWEQRVRNTLDVGKSLGDFGRGAMRLQIINPPRIGEPGSGVPMTWADEIQGWAPLADTAALRDKVAQNGRTTDPMEVILFSNSLVDRYEYGQLVTANFYPGIGFGICQHDSIGFAGGAFGDLSYQLLLPLGGPGKLYTFQRLGDANFYGPEYRRYGFAGPQSIGAASIAAFGGVGQLQPFTFRTPAWVKYDPNDGIPQLGEIWGPREVEIDGKLTGCIGKQVYTYHRIDPYALIGSVEDEFDLQTNDFIWEFDGEPPPELPRGVFATRTAYEAAIYGWKILAVNSDLGIAYVTEATPFVTSIKARRGSSDDFPVMSIPVQPLPSTGVPIPPPPPDPSFSSTFNGTTVHNNPMSPFTWAATVNGTMSGSIPGSYQLIFSGFGASSTGNYSGTITGVLTGTFTGSYSGGTGTITFTISSPSGAVATGIYSVTGTVGSDWTFSGTITGSI